MEPAPAPPLKADVEVAVHNARTAFVQAEVNCNVEIAAVPK